MEPLWIFSDTDNSIDLIGSLFFLLAAFHSIRFTYLNNINVQGKILYIFIAIISSLHVFQVGSQLYFGGPMEWTFRIWDITNYLTGALMLMIAERLYKRERYD